MSGCLKKEMLMAFADGELPQGEMESAERHISACAVCKQELESVRVMRVKVNALLSSLAPHEPSDADVSAVVRIPYSGANSRIRWTAVASVGVLVAALVLFAMIRRQHSPPATNFARALAPAPFVEKKEALTAVVTKPAQVGTPKIPAKVRQFQALDDGEPIETGMIYRVNLPAPSSTSASAQQSAKRIPAEVIVDEFGKVRAIRFLQ